MLFFFSSLFLIMLFQLCTEIFVDPSYNDIYDLMGKDIKIHKVKIKKIFKSNTKPVLLTSYEKQSTRKYKYFPVPLSLKKFLIDVYSREQYNSITSLIAFGMKDNFMLDIHPIFFSILQLELILVHIIAYQMLKPCQTCLRLF